MTKKLRLLAVLLAPLFLVSFDEPSERYFEISKNMEILSSVYAEVNRYYVDEVDPNTMMQIGIEAMLSSLDPYTNYIPEDDIEDFRFMSTGQYGGIGSLIGTRKGRVLILLPYEGFPAYKAGLEIGDEIIEIDGKNVEGSNTSDISKLLKGQAGTEVDLLIKRPNKKDLMTVPLIREKVTIKNVPYYGMVTDEVGYFKLTTFTRDASRNVQEALEKLREKGAKKFIFDLRGNTGGLLDEAVKISNLFIPKGKEVVSMKGKVKRWNESFYTTKDALIEDEKLVLLVNGKSASASEIVSGVMQDYDRGILVGSKTYGKGLVQATMNTAHNSKVKITTAKYYIPSGRCIQAIDYGKRDKKGRAIKVADSLIAEFETANGRKVYDGNGLRPDIKTEKADYPLVLASLERENLLFDFGTEYFYANKEIIGAKEFEVTPELYASFKEWLKDKEYDYVTKSEKELETFRKLLKNENVEVDSLLLNKINDKIQEYKEDDLEEFETEIKEQLATEIVSRYFYQSGIIESQFNDDVDVQKALELLNDDKKYKEVLGL